MRAIHLGLITIAGVGALSLSVVAQQGTGTPVPGLTPAQQTAFHDGSRTVTKNDTVSEGLGPVFNDESCNDCHRHGGGTNRTVTRFGRIDARGDFDSLVDLGGSLIQSRGIGLTTTAARADPARRHPAYWAACFVSGRGAVPIACRGRFHWGVIGGTSLAARMAVVALDPQARSIKTASRVRR